MLDNLTQRFSRVVKELRGQARLTDDNIQDALREVRLALLEADVALPVVRDFISSVREKAVGAEVTGSLTPGQALIGVVHSELAALMGGAAAPLSFAVAPPAVILLAGLQGAGKTTTAAKLARLVRQQNKKKVLLVSADVYRPAAIEQLHVVAKAAGVPSFHTEEKDPVAICAAAVAEAKLKGWDVVVLDTAGRLHLDETLMEELVRIKAATQPDEILFVADAMTGQDAVRSATAFHEKLGITGVILTKTDGDTRGGAAFSIKQATGRPLRFVGEGEKLEDFQRFHPDRMAQRILGMGDVLSLIEHAKDKIDEKEAEVMAKRLAKNQFTLEDMRKQFQQVQKLGSMQKILGFMPGMGQIKEQLATVATDKRIKHLEAIINSMTQAERANHNLLDGKRKRRISAGSGRPVSEINQLLKQFVETKKMMGQMNDPKFMDRMQRMAKMGGSPNLPF